MTGKLRPWNCLQKRLACSVLTSGASVQLFWVWHVLSGHTWITQRVQLWVSRIPTIVLSIYLAFKTNSVPPKTQLCMEIPLDLLNVITPVSEVSSCDYSNHLDINSAWKSLVAHCVCAWLKLKHAFSTCSSPPRNTFVSSAKSVCPQHKTRTSLAMRWSAIWNHIWRWVAEII